MEEKRNLGKFIQSKRKATGLSQKEMAEKLYVTESAVSKWERGVTYPDISMIQGICEVLSITEHELLTASDDYRQREIENHAKSFVKTTKIYNGILFGAYACSLIPCFIVNIAVNHKLSWFFIILFSELLVFSLLNVPVIAKKHKGLLTIGSSYLSLNILLGACCIFTGGDWFLKAFLGITFGLAVVFIPLVLHDGIFPQRIRKHTALISIAIDSALLILLCIFTVPHNLIKTAMYICAFQFILPWCYVVIIKYLKINGLFKAAVCLVITGINLVIENPMLELILEKKPFALPEINLLNWSLDYINGNVMMTGFLACTAAALLFTLGGILKECRKKDG